MLARIAALLRINPPVVDNRGLLWGSGADYPTLGSDGYQTGCVWCNTTGDAGTSLYVNEGDVTSANFVAVDTTAGASAGAITFDDNVTGPLISIETADPTNDSYTTPFIITGAYSSTADSALVVSSTNTRPVSFLFEDSGDVLGGDIRAGLFRLLLTVDQTAACTINALRAQIKANNLVDITNAGVVVAPLTGYLELDGAGARALDGHIACVRAALETGAGAHTVSKYLAGFEATLNSSGTFVGGGLTAAFLVDKSNGTSKWQYGLYLEDAAVLTTGIYVGTCTTGVQIAVCTDGITIGACTDGITLTGVVARAIDIQTTGVVRMGVEGTGVPLDNTYPYGFEVHTKTISDFAQPATGVSAGIYSRYEHSFDQVTATGHAAVFAKLRVKKDLKDGVHAASYNYVEISGGAATDIGGTATTQTAAGFHSVETDSGFILSTGHLNGVVVDSSIHVTGTFNGTISGIRIQKAGSAKAWPTGIVIVAAATETGVTIGTCTVEPITIATQAVSIMTASLTNAGGGSELNALNFAWTTTSTYGADADYLRGSNTFAVEAFLAIGSAGTPAVVGAAGSHVGILTNINITAALTADGDIVGGGYHVVTLSSVPTTNMGVLSPVTAYMRNTVVCDGSTEFFGVRAAIYTATGGESVAQNALEVAIIDKTTTRATVGDIKGIMLSMEIADDEGATQIIGICLEETGTVAVKKGIHYRAGTFTQGIDFGAGCAVATTCAWASTTTTGTAADPIYGDRTADSGVEGCHSVGTSATPATVAGTGSHVGYQTNLTLNGTLAQYDLFGGFLAICTVAVAQASVTDSVTSAVTGYIRNDAAAGSIVIKGIQEAVRGVIYTASGDESIRQAALVANIKDFGAHANAEEIAGLAMEFKLAARHGSGRASAIFIQSVNCAVDMDAVIELDAGNESKFTNFIKGTSTGSTCFVVNTSSSLDGESLQHIIVVEIDGDTGYIPVMAGVPT